MVSKVGDLLKELEETSYWLELLADSGAVSPKKLALLLDETSPLTAILTSIAKEFARGPKELHPSSFILSRACHRITRSDQGLSNVPKGERPPGIDKRTR
jgi:hypothetical protein